MLDKRKIHHETPAWFIAYWESNEQRMDALEWCMKGLEGKIDRLIQVQKPTEGFHDKEQQNFGR